MELKIGDKVVVITGKSTDIGFKVLVDNIHEGMLYHNEIFKPIHEGEQLEAYVKKIREDGRIDLSLQPQGFRNAIELNMDKVIEILHSNKGVLRLSDKSTPNEIYHELKMSKKAFKNAIGSLYKLKKIRIEEDAVHLLK